MTPFAVAFSTGGILTDSFVVEEEAADVLHLRVVVGFWVVVDVVVDVVEVDNVDLEVSALTLFPREPKNEKLGSLQP